MRGPKYDPQRDAVYAMESRELWGHLDHKVSAELIKKAARRLSRLARMPTPRVVFKHSDKVVGLYDPSTETIQLEPSGGMNYLVLCHEWAHYATDRASPYATAHGPTWMRNYGWALGVMGIVPPEGFRAMARRHGVKVRP